LISLAGALQGCLQQMGTDLGERLLNVFKIRGKRVKKFTANASKAHSIIQQELVICQLGVKHNTVKGIATKTTG